MVSPKLECCDVPGREDGAVVPGQLVSAVSAHLGGPGVPVPHRQPVKATAPAAALLQPELGEGEAHHLALRHSDGVVARQGVAVLRALARGEVNGPCRGVKVTATGQHLQKQNGSDLDEI